VFDCTDGANDNPLCQDSSGSFGTTQYMAKAYPSRRILWFLRDMGSRGVVGSICPAQQNDDGRFDFGHRPSVQAVLETVQHCR
jgi:hypothetical protein